MLAAKPSFAPTQVGTKSKPVAIKKKRVGGADAIDKYDSEKNVMPRLLTSDAVAEHVSQCWKGRPSGLV